MALHLIWTVQERQCWRHPAKEKAFKQIHYQNASDMQYSSPLMLQCTIVNWILLGSDPLPLETFF